MTNKEKFLNGCRFRVVQNGGSIFYYGQGGCIYRVDMNNAAGYSIKYEVLSITSSSFVFKPDMFLLPKKLRVAFNNLTFIDDEK